MFPRGSSLFSPVLQVILKAQDREFDVTFCSTPDTCSVIWTGFSLQRYFICGFHSNATFVAEK